MSAIQKPSSAVLGIGRPSSGVVRPPRRPYSAYTRKGPEEEGPKFDVPESNREWWRAYLKVTSQPIQIFFFLTLILKVGAKTKTKQKKLQQAPRIEIALPRRQALDEVGSWFWLLRFLQDTPNPGSYKQKSFLEELQYKRGTYHFQDTPRAKSASHQQFSRTGQHLLPGAYNIPDFLESMGKKKVTYGFVNTKRGQGPKIGHGFGDKVAVFHE